MTSAMLVQNSTIRFCNSPFLSFFEPQYERKAKYKAFHVKIRPVNL